MNINQSLIGELEDAVHSGSKEKRVDTLRRITDLFVADADRLNDQQIGVFDDVLGHLIKHIEAKALSELSRRLGPISNAPVDVVQCLARDDDISVAEPILTQSTRLSDKDLVEIARTKPQTHLLAISARAEIGTSVTDVLLERGDRTVFHRLAGNSGASFSENGFATLVKRSGEDEVLAEKVGLRLDVPLRLFRELLLRATTLYAPAFWLWPVRQVAKQIQRVLAAVSEDARHEAGFQSEHDYAEAQARVLAMRSTGELNEAAIFGFAKAGRYADMVAALSLLCGAPLKLMEKLLQSDHREALLVPCKSAGLQWPTVRMIMNCRSVGRAMSDQDIDAAHNDYLKLSPTSAARVLRFWQVRQTAANDVAISSASPLSTDDGSKSRISAS